MVQHNAGQLPAEAVPSVVEEELAQFFDVHAPAVSAIGQPVAEAISHLRGFILSGGKRIRPTYGWVGFTGAHGLQNTDEDPRAVLRAVSALEFIQGCALIHDDIIDASATRRGRPTVHRASADDHRARHWLGNADAYGEHIALLVGDLSLIWADDMWHHSGLSTEALQRASAPWRSMRAEVIGGQMLDIALEASGDEREASAHAVNRYKTAAYTIERPLHVGAAIAGATEQTVTALRSYGRDIGIAFQLRDDVLGVFGDPAVTGKPAGDDLREGKRTVMYSLALQAADERDPEAARRLRAGIGSVTDPEEIAQLAQIIKDTGAVDAVETRIAELTQSGLAHLENGSVAPAAVEVLTSLASSATARRR